ncbi:MAG TPA: WecB/TagA/CpsF family glycosyltransferase [Polyangiales bacterium]|nr:WecB/TagA/CpsF family glycosyltransferase [Polyangiales bacterium]
MELLGMALARVDGAQLLDHMFAELREGRGGWLVTANLDFLRRHAHDPGMRRLYDLADVRVADGRPLVWAAKLQGDHLPERVAGSRLMEPLAERAVQEGRSLYLLGGVPGAAEGAAKALQAHAPGLRICGYSSPFVDQPPTAEQLAPIVAELERDRPDFLLVALGSPKQELLIEALRPRFPATWMMGVGITFSFLAGLEPRAPLWMGEIGLEWVHRLAQDPKRLGPRYLRHDVPFALELFGRVALRRFAAYRNAT